MAIRQGVETVCPYCGVTDTNEYGPNAAGHGYMITFAHICPRCLEVLTKAFAGVAQAWSSAHGSAKERFFERLIDRLKKNGFDSVEPLRPQLRRH